MNRARRTGRGGEDARHPGARRAGVDRKLTVPPKTGDHILSRSRAPSYVTTAARYCDDICRKYQSIWKARAGGTDTATRTDVTLAGLSAARTRGNSRKCLSLFSLPPSYTTRTPACPWEAPCEPPHVPRLPRISKHFAGSMVYLLPVAGVVCV